MKKLIVLVSICISVAVILCSASTVLAEEDVNVGVELNVDSFSKFIWRGQDLTDDYVLQPSISVGYKNLSALIWGNMDLTNVNEQDDELSEIDYILEYSGKLPIKGIDWLNYYLGLIYYTPRGNEAPDTTELFWGFGLDCLLNPSVKVYHDIDEADGAYVSFSVGHSFEKIAEISGKPIGMDISSSLGWGSGHYNTYYWGIEHGSLNDLALSVSFPVEIDDRTTFTPSINYVSLVSGRIRESDAYSTESDYFFVGFGLNRRF